MKEHPVRQLFDKGVVITIGSDDPVFFKTDLTEEYWNLYNELNFTLDEIETLFCNGFATSFLPNSEKINFINDVKSAFKSIKK